LPSVIYLLDNYITSQNISQLCLIHTFIKNHLKIEISMKNKKKKIEEE